MRKLLLILLIVIPSFVGFAQSCDMKIAEAVNSSDWFELDSIYNAVPKDSISDFLEVFSRSMIGNRFNRPDISIPAFEELLKIHSRKLSLRQLVSSAVLFAIDLSRVGDNAKAASVLTSVYEGMLKDGNTKEAKILEKYIRQYSAMSEYDIYKIMIDGDVGFVPFKIVPVGKPEDKGEHINLEKSFINGIQADITFDTGAGVNIISESLVEKFNLIPIEVMTKVSGAQSHEGTFAIAKELKIGNITVRDVPFYVMDITANHSEANLYMQSIKIIVGSDLMLQLKDLTLDFENKRLIVPAEIPMKTETAPNLCFSSGMNLLAKGNINGTRLLMNIDTGDSGYGSTGKYFFEKNKKFIKSKSTQATFRKAGIGGVVISKGYKVPDMSLELGGNIVVLPSLNVMKKTDSFGYECNLGLKSLMLFKTVRFNLVDFVLITELNSQ